MHQPGTRHSACGVRGGDRRGRDERQAHRKELLSLEQTYKDLTDKPRDAGITFESTGIDYVVVDEVHDYKNLATESSIQDARIAGAGRATDLHMKLEYLRSRHGDRVVTVATATPLANSITEAYVMQRYLRPDLLENAGIGHFDAWVATFGQTVTEMEMAPTATLKRPATDAEVATHFSQMGKAPRQPVAGYDLVFTPVKSVSVLWALGDMDTSERVREAHNAAWQATVAWLETEAGVTRVGAGGVAQVDTHGFVATAFDPICTPTLPCRRRCRASTGSGVRWTDGCCTRSALRHPNVTTPLLSRRSGTASA
ncbi:hypothetical protein E3O06_06605 [Cryobacterium glaciale]|uniref:TrwC relaxase domain-containing protein n=1 Tax=Cryobacterium glaciale TaxID=1259145 RepID=A0A4R8UZ19_9MICO|nr:hypothetical protein E3O06_06605 [Cryobacterium glaciale]